MESSIFKFFAKIFHALAVWFDESVFGKAYNSLCIFLAKCFKYSFLGKFFCTGLNTKDMCEASLLYRIIYSPIKLCSFIAKKTGVFWEKTVEDSSILRLANNWELVSIRIYGVILFFFVVTFSVLNTILNGINLMLLAICGAALVFAIFMILINRSPKSLFKGSEFLRSFGGLFCEVKKESSKLFLQDKDIVASGMLFGTFVGISCGALAVLLPLKIFVILVGGMFGALLVIKYLELGVFLTVIGSPILPTTILAGMCLLCVVSLVFKMLTDRNFKLKTSSLDIFVIFFMGALAYGVINSFTFIKSAQILMIYFSYILFYFVIVATTDSRKKWKALVVSFALVSCVVALYGILQNFTGISSQKSWVDSDMFQSIKTRVYSTFDNPNVLGEFLVIMIPTTAALLWANKKHGHKMVYTFIILCLCACIVFTWSRGAWLGVMLAVALFLLVMDKRWALAGVVALFALPFILSTDNAITQRILSIGNTKDTSTAYRVSIWMASVKLIRDFWMSGIGLGSEAFAMIYPKYALAGANFALHSHNLFLQIWVEMGLIGIVSFFALIIAFIRQAFSLAVYKKRGGVCATVIIGASAGILGYLFQGLTDNVWYNYKMLLVFWIVLGLVSAGVNINKQKDE
ncbi:MAG: O-antigen ligase family protein [Clostridia bacterium]|nr:O-antigen ligase family protein [Clostridia bacterium]